MRFRQECVTATPPGASLARAQEANDGYLTSLFTNDNAVAAAPADWLPWNYEHALVRLAQQPAAAA